MSEFVDEGSICDECPHPLSEHELTIGEMGTLVVCRTPDENCRCIREHKHETPPLNQGAVQALGARKRDLPQPTEHEEPDV